jgi:hypothetical protein
MIRRTSNPEPAPAAPATAATAPPPATKRRGRPKGSVNGNGTGIRVATKRVDSASPQAKSTAAVILEGLTGLRSAPDAARALGITVARYYTVEAQAVAGLLAACEPGSPGPVPNAATERELTRLREEHRRQDQELARLRAVLRTTQRSLGLPMVAATPPAPPGAAKGAEQKPSGTGAAKGKSTDKKRRRARRPVVRALTVLRRLQAAQEAPAAAPATSTVSTPPTPAGTSSTVPVGG